MSLYVGINNSPKNITSLLIGKNNVTKKASSAYTGGVNSKYLIYESFNLDKELTQVNPVAALTSGKIRKSDIGKTVYLSNSFNAACQEWQIADINRDGTIGTVDLVSKYVLHDGSMWSFDDDGSSIITYRSSKARKTVNDFYNYFTDQVKNAIKTQQVVSNGSYYEDKVRMPSLTEVGCRCYSNGTTNGIDNYMPAEGTIYPIFGNTQVWKNSLAIRNKSGVYNGYAGPTSYWVRTVYKDSSRCYAVSIESDGTWSTQYQERSYKFLIGIIRF